MSTRNRIAEKLAAKGWTPLQLANALHGMGFHPHQFTVQKWVQGESEPRGIALTLAVARALDCEVADLICETVEAAS